MEHYIAVYPWMISKLNLDGKELVLYAYIYGSGNVGWVAQASYSELADLFATSRSRIIKHINSLRKKNLIEVQTGTKNSIFKALDYNKGETYQSGVNLTPQVVSKTTQSGVNLTPPLLITNKTKEITKKELIRKKSSPSSLTDTNTNTNTSTPKTEKESAMEEQFNTFWNKYPKHRKAKSAHKKAHQMWMDLSIDSELYGKVMSYIDNMSEEWEKDDGKYVPNILKFLENQRWQDTKILTQYTQEGIEFQKELENLSDEEFSNMLNGVGL